MNKEKVAFIFPGQASQTPGMGLDLYKNSKAAREVFDEADEILGRKLSSVIFEGSKEELTKTENAQPSIATVSIAAWRAIEEEMGTIQIPNYTAGHSLGEYSSLATAGALSIKETIKEFLNHAQVDYPQECCGFILGRLEKNKSLGV